MGDKQSCLVINLQQTARSILSECPITVLISQVQKIVTRLVWTSSAVSYLLSGVFYSLYLKHKKIVSGLPITFDDANRFSAIVGDLLVSAVSLWLECSLSSFWIAY